MVTTLDRLRDCGRAAHGPNVTLRLSEGRAGVAGTMTCGSVWACSVCSAKIAMRRHDELKRGISNWRARGGRIAMLTLTMRHKKTDRLGKLWDALSYGWNGVTSGRRWIEEKDRYGLAGYVRVAELTHTKNGWHVHVHALLFIKSDEEAGRLGPLTSSDLAGWKHGIVQRWGKRLGNRDITQLDNVQDLRFMGENDGGQYSDDEVDDFLAGYLAKAVDNGEAVSADVAAEVAFSSIKKGRRDDSRTPFGILDDVIRYADADDAALWWEYEDASRGRRQMTWSKGLRELLEIEEEKSDEDIADEEEGTKDDDVLSIPAGDWFHLSAGGHLIVAVLHELETHGVDACESLIVELGYHCTRVVSRAG